MVVRDTIEVHKSNRQQVQAWDGDEGAYWAAHAQMFERSAVPFHERLLAAAAIGPTERVLDVGCGTGRTTIEAARTTPQGSALGVDLSSQMIAHARRRVGREGPANATFEQADAQVHPFEPSTFDVAISSTGATFFGDLVAAFGNIRRALRPGARVALLNWQSLHENEWIREFSTAMAAGRDLPAPPPDSPGPFALADPDRTRTVLGSAGFTDVDIEGAHVGMWFGADADEAHGFVLGLLGWMLDGLDDTGRERAVAALRATMEAHETDAGVVFDSAVWTVTAGRP